MDRAELIQEIARKRSFLCVGLDSDLRKLPACLPQNEEGLLTFNKAIIDATATYAVAYKPNAAFYEARGSRGVAVLEQTVAYLQQKYPECLVILDAKRGDIGNTSGLYARAAFEEMAVDAITVAPYMGEDSIAPFMGYPGTVSYTHLNNGEISHQTRGLDIVEVHLEAVQHLSEGIGIAIVEGGFAEDARTHLIELFVAGVGLHNLIDKKLSLGAIPYKAHITT